MIVRAVVILVLLCGCRQLLGFENATVADDVPGDGPSDTLVIPDAGPCTQISDTCVEGVVLRSCVTIGAQPIDTVCQ